jgi:hypothetical protein
MKTKEEIEAWIKREYPNGDINWRNEYERLVNVLQQAVVVGLDQKFAATKLLVYTALPIAEYLIKR